MILTTHVRAIWEADLSAEDARSIYETCVEMDIYVI